MSPILSSSLSPQDLREAVLASLRPAWFMLVILGLLLIGVGMAAVGCALTATLATMLFVGVFLITGAVLQLLSAFGARQWGGFFLQVLSGILSLVVGILFVERPLEAAAGLTLLIAAALMVEGIARIILAVMDRFEGWGWVLLNGIISLALGVSIWRKWPDDSLWIIGLFVGIDLIFCGVTSLMLGLKARSYTPANPA
ncbi:MAG: HdeD family acid-resistance protein [Gemmataceae bacterium]